MSAYSAESARIDATEARARAEAYALENAPALLGYIYSEIRKEAAMGGDSCYIRLVPTDKSQSIANAVHESACRFHSEGLVHVPSGVALEEYVLILVVDGQGGIKPTAIGKAVLKHLQSMGYEAAFESYPDGALVVSWGSPYAPPKKVQR